MKNELTIQHLAPYLPYGLKVKYKDCIYDKTHIATLSGVSNDAVETTYKRRFKGCSGDCIFIKGRNNIIQLNFTPILHPLSDLTKEIEHNGERFVPIEFFEIGDTDNCFYEFDFGNIRLIKQIKTIANYNVHHDINFLPFAVVQKLFEWHFDVFGLIEKGLAIDINTIQK